MLLFKAFFKKIVEQNKQVGILVFLLLNWLLVVLRITKLDKTDSDMSVLNTTKEKYILSRGIYFLFLDYLYLYVGSLLFYFNNFKGVVPVNIKIQQLNNNNFYKFNNVLSVFSVQQLCLYGLKSV
jgi:hypothetical protein